MEHMALTSLQKIIINPLRANELRSTLLAFIFAIHRIVTVINFEVTKMPFHVVSFLACIIYLIQLSLKRCFGSRTYLSISFSEEADIILKMSLTFGLFSIYILYLVGGSDIISNTISIYMTVVI